MNRGCDCELPSTGWSGANPVWLEDFAAMHRVEEKLGWAAPIAAISVKYFNHYGVSAGEGPLSEFLNELIGEALKGKAHLSPYLDEPFIDRTIRLAREFVIAVKEVESDAYIGY